MKRLINAPVYTCRDCVHSGMPKNKFLKFFLDPVICDFDWDNYHNEEFETMLSVEFDNDFEQFMDYCANDNCSICPQFKKQE